MSVRKYPVSVMVTDAMDQALRAAGDGNRSKGLAALLDVESSAPETQKAFTVQNPSRGGGRAVSIYLSAADDDTVLAAGQGQRSEGVRRLAAEWRQAHGSAPAVRATAADRIAACRAKEASGRPAMFPGESADSYEGRVAAHIMERPWKYPEG